MSLTTTTSGICHWGGTEIIVLDAKERKAASMEKSSVAMSRRDTSRANSYFGRPDRASSKDPIFERASLTYSATSTVLTVITA